MANPKSLLTASSESVHLDLGGNSGSVGGVYSGYVRNEEDCVDGVEACRRVFCWEIEVGFAVGIITLPELPCGPLATTGKRGE